MRHPDRTPQRLLARMAGVSLAFFALGQPVRAQFGGDYFDPYRAAYRSSMLPVETRIVPGQARTATGATTDANKKPSIGTPRRADIPARSVSLPIWPHPLAGTTLPGKAGWRGRQPYS